MRFVRHLLSLLLAAVMLASALPAAAAVTEMDVKAAFLPRFARYVTWPANARPNGSDPFVLCVIGSDPFGSALDTAARSQSVDGHRIIVRRTGSAGSAGGCHIAFIGAGGAESIGESLAMLRSRPVLTVTDSRNGGQRGIIHFAIAGGRVRFYINEAGAADRNLSISSRLLALAISVNQR